MYNATFQRIKETGNLPSPTGVALRLLDLVADERTTIEQVVATVEADPAIALRLLKLVNSPLAGAARKVAAVSTAVKLLGLQSVRSLALGHSLISSYRTGRCSAFDYERFWSQSLARAVAARAITSRIDGIAPDEAFTLALLSRIGRLALATVFPDVYADLLSQTASDSFAALGHAESQQFGIDHNELSALMMAEWHLPDVFCEAVRIQDAVDHAGHGIPSRTNDVARALRVADASAALLVNDSPFQDDLSSLFAMARACGMTQNAMSAAYETARSTWREAGAIFSVRTAEAPALPELLCRASRDYRQVLVVDDDPASVRLMRKQLTNAGYDVVEAHNAAEAFRMLHTKGCRLVITDWNMPGMDGLQLCRAISEDQRSGFVYTILVTADSASDALSNAFEAGAHDFLHKPYDPAELLARVRAGVRAVDSDAKLAAQKLELVKSNAELAVLNAKLERSATTDELTNLGNRRAALRQLSEKAAHSTRKQTALACMLIDIDHFKRINDTFGHEAGDIVLRETAMTLQRAARADEPVFRLGGEEFLVLCPGSSANDAEVGGERFRNSVEKSTIEYGDHRIALTISVGVAEWDQQTKTTEDLLRKADEALYSAKRSGRNRVCVFDRIRLEPDEPAREPFDLHVQPADDRERCCRVLVVDDDPDCRRLCRLHLARAGHDVVEADSGAAALRAAALENPDVVVMDVMMPGMTGIECTRQMKSNRSTAEIPVLLASGRTEPWDIVEGFKAGAEEYVTKPIQPRAFVARVESLARSQRKTRQLQSAIAELATSNAARGEQARAMGILFELAHAVSLADHEDAALRMLVDATVQLLLCRRVSIMLPTADGTELRIAKSFGIDHETAKGIKIAKGKWIAGKVFATGERIIANSADVPEVRRHRDDATFFESVPLASVALGPRTRVMGVLNVTERIEHKPFNDKDLQYLDLIADLAHSCLEQLRSRRLCEEVHRSIVVGLAMLAEFRDLETGQHLERVTKIARLIAEELGKRGAHVHAVDATFLSDLQDAMPLHDIGKVGIPDGILLKDGPFTLAERTIVEQHPGLGAKAIQAVIDKVPAAGFMTMARDIALYHHERFDGTGYPCGLAGERIPLAARIAAVADVYDAMTNDRPYRNALNHSQAVNVIRSGAGSQFDPHVVDAFLRCEDRIKEVGIELDRDFASSATSDESDRRLLTTSR